MIFAPTLKGFWKSPKLKKNFLLVLMMYGCWYILPKRKPYVR